MWGLQIVKGFWLPDPQGPTNHNCRGWGYRIPSFRKSLQKRHCPKEILGSMRTWLFEGGMGSFLLIQTSSITSGGKGMTNTCIFRCFSLLQDDSIMNHVNQYVADCDSCGKTSSDPEQEGSVESRGYELLLRASTV